MLGEGVGPAARVSAFLWVMGPGAPVKAAVHSLPTESQQGAEPGHRAPQEKDV